MIIRLSNRMDLRRLRRRAVSLPAEATSASVYLYNVTTATGTAMTADLSGVGQYSRMPFTFVSMERTAAYSFLPFTAVSMGRTATHNLLPFATVSMERTATHDLVKLV